MIECKNCGNHYEGRYCNVCGQKADTPPFTLKTLLRIIISNLFDVDKGVLRNIKDLTFRPTATIRGYLDGKRGYYYDWIKYLLLSISIATVLTAYSSAYREIYAEASTQTATGKETQEAIFNTLMEYFNLFYLPMVFIIALFSYWFFRKYNYIEHLVINAMIIAQGNIFYVFLFVPILLIEKLGYRFTFFGEVLLGYILFWMLYTMVIHIKLFEGNLFLRIIKAFFTFVLSYVIYLIVIIIAMIILIVVTGGIQ